MSDASSYIVEDSERIVQEIGARDVNEAIYELKRRITEIQ